MSRVLGPRDRPLVMFLVNEMRRVLAAALCSQKCGAREPVAGARGRFAIYPGGRERTSSWARVPGSGANGISSKYRISIGSLSI